MELRPFEGRVSRRSGSVIAVLAALGGLISVSETSGGISHEQRSQKVVLQIGSLSAEGLTRAEESVVEDAETTTTTSSTTTTTSTSTTSTTTTTTLPQSEVTPSTSPAANMDSAQQAWLLALRDCESGGNYSEDTGNGYYGAYQFALSTWESLNTGFPNPVDAPPSVQDEAIIANTNRSSGGLVSQNPDCYEKTGISAFPPS